MLAVYACLTTTSPYLVSLASSIDQCRTRMPSPLEREGIYTIGRGTLARTALDVHFSSQPVAARV